MNILENPKLPAILFIAVVGVVAVTFYLNTRFSFIEIPLIQTQTAPEVIVDLPSVTTHPTIPAITITKTSQRVITPTSSQPTTSITPKPTETSSAENQPTPLIEQNEQVIASFLSKALICKSSQVEAAKNIILATEEKIKPIESTHDTCTSNAEAQIQSCFNGCSSYLDVVCTEGCAEQYDPVFTTCDTSYQSQKNILVDTAKQELEKLCILL